ncbi:zinc finger protein 292a [Alosa alosa]|uniref:zinc finger protein 292a n=1 Tax=Alosa alosa TaxID=278164 RepID=UPI0020153300|nr:zinc finger protein 292a [Alosa alosa]
MAEEEAERECNTREVIVALRKRFQELITGLKESSESALDASSSFCQEFCQVLVEHGSRWKTEEDPLPLLEMYTVAILSYAEATPSLSPECEQAPLVLDKLGLSCMDLLLSLSEQVPGALWEEFQSSVKLAHAILLESGNSQLQTLSAVAAESGIWTNSTLCSVLSNETPETEKVNEFLVVEGPVLLDMRIKHLIKQNEVEKAARLAKVCTEFPEFGGKRNFKQAYLVCLCGTSSTEQLKQEIAEVDCKDALDMICNLESEGDEKGAFSLCSAFLKRQLVQGDVYCAWELTLLWSKLLMRLESAQAFLDQCRQLVILSTSVYHILLLIKVIQSEVENVGLPVCIEMCIQALKMGASDGEDSKATICKTISCLMPNDLEVKRACQLTEFLLKPTVDSYYAVETLFNEPDQKLEEESLPIPNSLRCDLLLALKTQWPFDPEFWDWKTLKRNCLTLMGDEASIVSSIDELNDNEEPDGKEDGESGHSYMDLIMSPSVDLSDLDAERQKKREIKKLREQGFVSARFRNWRAYMQYCVLCDKEFLGHRIVKHALKHVQDGLYRCPICAQSFETRQVLEPHVASHVKQSSKERLAAMNITKKKLPKSPTKSPLKDYILKKSPVVKVNPEAKVQAIANTPNITGPPGSSAIITPKSKPEKTQRAAAVSENTEDCSCPVTSCQKVFKYFRNLVAHMRVHKDDEEAKCFLETHCQKAICQYCRRQFVNMTHLNDHLKMHCGPKPYYCIQLNCKASFPSHAELLMHRKVHTGFQAQCMFPDCGRIFTETYQLYDHEAQHYIMFTCKAPNCGKVFYSQALLTSHMKEHVKQEMSSTFTEQTNPDSVQVLGKSPSKADDATGESASVKIKHSVESMLNDIPAAAAAATAEEIKDGAGTQTPTDAANAPSRSEPETTAGGVPVIQPLKATEAKVSTEFNLKGPLPITQPCSVKLKPIPINTLEAVELQPQTIIQDKKLFSCPKDQPLLVEIKREQPLTTCSSSMSQQGSASQRSVSQEADDKLTHVCPFEACTRRYCTSKSLARHVKKVHSEAFEEWKLSRRYKRLAEMAARKQSNVQRSPSKQVQKMNTTGLASPQKDASTRQLPYSVESGSLSEPSSFSPNSMSNCSLPFYSGFCSQPETSFCETLQNPAGLIHSDITQLWHSPTANDYSCDYTQQSDCPSKVLPDQLQGFHSFSPEMNRAQVAIETQNDTLHTTAPSDDGNVLPMMSQDSSVMNQASKYISSSLMVLHSTEGGQQCDLAQTERSVGHMESPMQSHSSGITHNNSLSHSDSMPAQGLHPYVSNMPTEVHAQSVEPLGSIDKSLSFDHHDRYVSSLDVNNMAHLNSPPYKSHVDNTATHLQSPTEMLDCTNSYFSNTGEASDSQMQDLDSDGGTFHAAPGIDSTDKKETSGEADETKKLKKVRSSKRTKWPAIIKDGKVICRRCYREFSSTKSLGGHLSKRSQCKAFDEVDLNADLPTSFLDFLNDPDVSTVYQTAVTPTVKIEDAYKGKPIGSCMYQSAESNYVQNGSFPDFYESTYNMNFPKQEDGIASSCTSDAVQHTALNQSESLVADASQSLPNTLADQSKGAEVNIVSEKKHTSGITLKESVTNAVDVASTGDGEDSKVVEIQRALQRLDLVDAVLKDSLKVNESSSLNMSKSEDCSKERPKQTVVPKRAIKKEADPNVSKPFKCEKADCSYGAMTKEALFKHLFRIHNYTDDMINELKKLPDKFSPYSCHICEKNFTRTTGLRIHYMNVHHMAKEAIPKIKVSKIDRTLKSTAVGKASLTPKSIPVNHPVNHCNGLKVERLQEPFEPKKKVTSQLPEKTNISAVAGQGTLNQDMLSSDMRLSVDNSVDPSTAGPLHPVNSNEKTTKGSFKTEVQSPTEVRDIKAIKVESGPELIKDDTGPELKIDTTVISELSKSFRPYSCVHQGCTAAFSIEQNLTLHYRAVHQTDHVAEQEGVSGDGADASFKASDLVCQVEDCSKVLHKATSLFKHYLLHHKFTVQKSSTMLTGVDVGTFPCDQNKCSASFTSFLKYIDHVKDHHKAIRVSEGGDGSSAKVDLSFKCDCDGCDRSYTTKSNLLRHLMKKHQDVYEDKIKPKNFRNEDLAEKKTKPGLSPNNGKENMVNNKLKMKKKNLKKKGKVLNHWTSFGQPSLKSMDEASAMCTKRFPLQYPCMIKGCDSVSSAERNIFKHYATHGLTERYIEDQRSQFIFCKKYPRSRNMDASKSDGTSTEGSEDEDETVNGESSGEMAEDSLESPSQDESADVMPSESQLMGSENTQITPDELVVKRKRGRPPKMKRLDEQDHTAENAMKESELNTEEQKHYSEEEFCEESQNAMNSLELEPAFLSLLEESTDSLKRKATESCKTETPPKKQRTLQQQSSNIMGKRPSDFKRRTTSSENLVHFRNPLNIKSVKNVKIVMDKAFSNGADLLLKQLQDMRPIVILKKWLYS